MSTKPMKCDASFLVEVNILEHDDNDDVDTMWYKHHSLRAAESSKYITIQHFKHQLYCTN